MWKITDKLNRRYGALVVIALDGDRETYKERKLVRWRCRCDCGNEIVLTTGHLRPGRLGCGRTCPLKPPSNPRKFTPDQAAQLLDEWRAGTSIRHLSIKYNSNWTTVWKTLAPGMMDQPRLRPCKDCPTMLRGASNGQWRERCAPCKVKYDAQMAVRSNRQRLTGLSHEEYERLLRDQAGVCAICGKGPLPGKVLGADHDHITLQTRGLLCGLCNVGLGAFGDDTETMKRAIEYLGHYKQMSLFRASATREDTRDVRRRLNGQERRSQDSVFGASRRKLRFAEQVSYAMWTET